MSYEIDTALRKAKLQLKRKNTAAADKIYKDILTKFPKNQRVAGEYLKLKKEMQQNQPISNEAPRESLLEVLGLYNAKKFQDAVSKTTKLLEYYPKSYLLWNILGASHHEQKNYKDAEEAFTVVVELLPEAAEGFFVLGNAQRKQNKLGDALISLKRALQLDPKHSNAWNNIGLVYRANGDHKKALLAIRTAININPKNPEFWNNCGNTLANVGDFDAAAKSYEQAIDLQPNNGKSYRQLALIKSYKLTEKQIVGMQNLYDSNVLSVEDLSHLCFALAEVNDEMGEWKKAFDFYKEGNALRLTAIPHDFKNDQEMFKRAKSSSKQFLENGLDFADIQDNFSLPTPIFIIGMARSGTTLTEQIISAHSEVFGAGELELINDLAADLVLGDTTFSKNNIVSLRLAYLNELKKLSNGKPFVSDKMPHNFIYLALIRAAFPEAKIIHVRRNAGATCWSNFTKYFGADPLGYAYDLKTIAEFYSMYLDLMRFWEKSFGEKIYNLNYDQLTNNPDEEIYNLIESLGLPWQEQCLSPDSNKRVIKTASHHQVRSKIYTGSSQKWLKYRPLLNGVFDNLD